MKQIQNQQRADHNERNPLPTQRDKQPLLRGPPQRGVKDRLQDGLRAPS